MNQKCFRHKWLLECNLYQYQHQKSVALVIGLAIQLIKVELLVAVTAVTTHIIKKELSICQS